MLGKAYIEVFRYRDEGLDYDRREVHGRQQRRSSSLDRDECLDHDRREEFRGALQHQVDGAADFVLGELGFDMTLLGTKRHELHRLPRVVLGEAVANTVAHRSYERQGEAVRNRAHMLRLITNPASAHTHGPCELPAQECASFSSSWSSSPSKVPFPQQPDPQKGHPHRYSSTTSATTRRSAGVVFEDNQIAVCRCVGDRPSAVWWSVTGSAAVGGR